MNYERMKEIRENKEITQKIIADILDVSRSTYAGWENGIDTIPLLKLNKFCNYFNVSFDYICGLSDSINYSIINTEINKEIVGINLKSIRVENNDTQEKISNIIQTDQSNYSKYEKGKTLILTSLLIDFAKHYNISIDYILGKTKSKTVE